MSYEEFRRRIDTMRQILVGAVPSPAGQIDQITYALMYKFMNDIDDQSAALGGVRTYFTGEYEKYNWHALMSSSLGAHERLELYRQAIQTMAKNENIPELFRSIYQNAFLPFNSANVLTLFLKEADKFSHGETDDIGDAYEYLLSITGAQGDVGQFRTPRHIIKFIAEAVNPTKDDKVLDPAVGTAGFLIAAYNHVRSKHDGKDNDGSVNNEKRLTADELDKIHHNYRGFDIDPTMVRTAKVNMYLHGFKTPDIINHDSLSSEEYWNDRYDVILANPPFMTPKGGIQPHKKFGISANRAEVLFVDYIASHLKPTGRAGIVVPEGIIFQSGKAYKELRKNLVENYLYAVVSLPAGVFQPYSGVKTSVLLFDKELAKQRDEILFVKVENDGYSLGAQRRAVVGDQFPEALEVIEKFKAGEEFASEFAHSVSRSEIAESGDYNLSGDRYKVLNHNINQEHEYFSIEELVDTISATVKIKTADILESGVVPVIDQSQKYIAGYTNNRDAEITSVPIVAFGDHTKAVKYVDFPFAQGADGIKILKPKNDLQLSPKYLFYAMSNMEMPNKGYSRHWSDVKRIKIPLPPIEIQREIVAELDGYQKIIDAAQTIVQTYKPTIKTNPDWEIAKLEDIATLIQRGKSPKYGDSNIQVIKSGQARGFYEFDFSKVYNTVADFPLDHRKLENGDLLINSTGVGTAGRVTLFRTSENNPFLVDSHITILRLNSTLALSDYVLYALAGKYGFDGIEKLASGSGGQIELSLNTIKNMDIPLPPIEIQREIVAELEAEQQLINTNKKLIEIYQQKIKSKIAEVWGV